MGASFVGNVEDQLAPRFAEIPACAEKGNKKGGRKKQECDHAGTLILF
jgi:hypothetical protein